MSKHELCGFEFSIERRGGSWAVVRNDGVITAIGFETQAEADNFIATEIANYRDRWVNGTTA